RHLHRGPGPVVALWHLPRCPPPGLPQDGQDR
ncbi:hypothetical protein BN1708_019331, partial [Verticillium longisporum]